jgi:antitoxin (DNA-binding transcriptional repressor) of toxin-antitoxin stability system
MKSNIGIAELKAHLSEYVRGGEIIIKDRQTPVAKLVPIEQPQMIGEIRRATRSVAEVQRMLNTAPIDAPLPPETFQRILDEERADHSDEWITART